VCRPAAPAIIPRSRFRRLPAAVLLTGALAASLAGVSSADLTSRYQTGQERSGQLRARIRAETSRIQGFEGTVGSLQGRLMQIQAAVAVQERLLSGVTSLLAAAGTQLTSLRVQYARDRIALASQLRADYEAPPPTIVDVVVDSAGFQDLLTRVQSLTAIEQANVRTTVAVSRARIAVAAQARRLAQAQARRSRATAAVLVERDTVAQLKVSIVNRELAVVRTRGRDAGRLTALHAQLVHEAQILDQRAAAAQTLSAGGGVAPPGGCTSTPFVAHGGSYGFFPAPGTNYTVNQEPVIAARLDQLGRALQLQLIGISGYRTPQHSVEVGGFADDPHTRGEASDTPGVEGVPESTLEEFCLTRPFPGAREADHIQLL